MASSKDHRTVVKTYAKMPGKIALNPLPPGTKQPGLAQSLLYSGSRFQGHQKSKGNRYDVEVVLKVSSREPCRKYSKKFPPYCHSIILVLKFFKKV